MAVDMDRARRIVSFMNGAPRTWDEIVGVLSGVMRLSDPDISADQALRAHEVSATLFEMVAVGLLVREPADSPAYDIYRPVASVEERRRR